MDEKNKIFYFEDLEEYRKNNIFNIPNILFIQYLNLIYPNLVLRESDFIEINESSLKSDILSKNVSNNKTLLEKQISSNTFSQYLGIQNLISDRIFKYIDKSKKGKITKNDFCNGLYLLFFGNVVELSKLTFFICDFNEDGKIYKSDMKLILSYIPKQLNGSNSSQFEYINKINKKIDELFDEIKEAYPKIKDNLTEELDYDLYLSKINDCINDNGKSINGAFFLFINLLKYIFINKPFTKENVDPVKYVKNKYLLKVSIPKGGSVKNLNQLTKKSLVRSEVFENNNNKNSININNDLLNYSINRKTEKKNTDYKKHIEGIGKIQQNDLFSIKKSSSAANIDKNIQKKYGIIKHDYIMAKNKENINAKNNNNNEFQNVLNELDSKNKQNHKKASIGRLNSGKNNFYFNSSILKLGNKIILRNKVHKNTTKSVGNSVNISEIENNHKNGNNNLLPSISGYTPNKINLNINNNKLNLKVSPIIKLKNKCVANENENSIKISNFENKIDTYNDTHKEFGYYLYKFSEEEYHISIKKYYAVLNKKEILFYSSNIKNELCSIWNLNDTVISIMKKSLINKYLYYPIKIIYKNNYMNYILFEEKDFQIEFGKQIKINIGNKNYEEKYESKEKIGEGHFAVVKKCIEKKSGKEYAVKIIEKNKLKKKDMDLILQEKNYMKLIKHQNIVSLKEDFEDEKYIYLVMDYYKGGDLYSYIYEERKEDNNLTEKIIAKIIKIIAQCIQYLNNFGIVHRDLKPENIVFGEKNNISSLTIIDLGVAIVLPFGQTTNEAVGTLEYISPEIFTRKPYSHKVDVWSLGIILYILITMGKIFPFDCESKDKEERDKIIGKKIVFLQQDYPIEFFKNKSKYLINLIDKSLEKSPDKRISIDDFLSNYWLINNSK